jgi:hypothetical protein
MLYGMSDLISYIRDRVAVEQVFLMIFSAVQCKLSCCTILVCLWPQESLLALNRQYNITVKILQSTYRNMTTLWCHEIYNPHSQTLQLTVGQIVWRSYGCRGKQFSLLQNHADRLWGPPSLLFSSYWCSFLWVKWLGPKVDSSPSSSAEVKSA